MTMRRGGSRRRFARTSRGARRQTAWAAVTTEPTSVVAGGQSFVNLTPGLISSTSPGREGMTIVRIVGTLRANSLDASLSCESAWGIHMVEEDAAAASAIPDPLADAHKEWMYWDRRVLLPASDAGQQLHLDIRAMRRFRTRESEVLFVIDNDDAVQSLEFALGFRLLLKLP